MHSPAQQIGYCALLLPLALVSGCGGSDGHPATYRVTGVVTLDGVPAEGADVFFSPIAAGQAAAALVEADGGFSVQTAFDMGRTYRRGMVPGEYRVTVEKIDTAMAYKTGREPPNLLPPRYADAETSGFTATVTEDGDNRFTFALTSD